MEPVPAERAKRIHCLCGRKLAREGCWGRRMQAKTPKYPARCWVHLKRWQWLTLGGRTASFSPFQAIPMLFVECPSLPRLDHERHYKCLKISVQDCCELFQHAIRLSFGTVTLFPSLPRTFEKAVFRGSSWVNSPCPASDESKNEVFCPPMYLVPLTPCLLELYLPANKAWHFVGAGPQENNKQLQ